LFHWLIALGVVSRTSISHQFGVLTFGGCEAIFFGIRAFLDLHPDWAVMRVNVENYFNSVFRAVIYRELCDVKRPLTNIIPFTKFFYGDHSSIYYQHGWHVEGVTTIESFLNTRQGDPLGSPLFTLAHY